MKKMLKCMNSPEFCRTFANNIFEININQIFTGWGRVWKNWRNKQKQELTQSRQQYDGGNNTKVLNKEKITSSVAMGNHSHQITNFVTSAHQESTHTQHSIVELNYRGIHNGWTDATKPTSYEWNRKFFFYKICFKRENQFEQYYSCIHFFIQIKFSHNKFNENSHFIKESHGITTIVCI